MYNIGGVRIFGDEIAASATYGAGPWEAGLTARYSYQWAHDTETDGQIPYIPLHSASFQFFGTWNGFRLEVQGFLTGERFTSSSNRPEFRIAPWTTWDATLGWQGKRLKLGLQCKNLFNEQYQIVQQYPMPGFHVLVSLDYSF
jgi:outer membrane receptor protein involved in Fe transport